MAWEITVGLTFLSIIITFGYLSAKVDKKQGHLGVLFLIISMFAMVVALNISAQLATNNSSPAVADMTTSFVKNFTYIIFFVIGLIIIQFVWNLLRSFFGKSKQEKEEDGEGDGED